MGTYSPRPTLMGPSGRLSQSPFPAVKDPWKGNSQALFREALPAVSLYSLLKVEMVNQKDLTSLVPFLSPDWHTPYKATLLSAESHSTRDLQAQDPTLCSFSWTVLPSHSSLIIGPHF